ncbi:nucleotide exchange factor GrpE [Desulfogranum japonicum]|uniref:nucleotide exchange factor GrpE n=1 Tax=Desulfogranum japonicum TaxID=231447 RepID=UPI00041E5497|nr:nucleotide exchange factor GrpE [Desulfogranum japonicum]
MDNFQKTALQEQFSTYLDMVDMPGSSDEGVDLMSLFRELSGLKNEVRLESRQLKGALDDFRQAFTALDHGQQELIASLEKSDASVPEDISPENSAQVQGMIDLYDRVRSGLQQAPPVETWLEKLLGVGRRYRKWEQGHREGQSMLLKRIEQLLEQENVSAMDVVHQPFDPYRMKAVGSLSEKKEEDGIVLEEQRTGFLIGNRILRVAEVIVNKKGTSA